MGVWRCERRKRLGGGCEVGGEGGGVETAGFVGESGYE